MMTSEEVVRIQDDIIKNVFVSEKILEYILAIVEATRTSKYLLAGVSTRGALAITATAKAHAYFQGRDFVVPEDIKELALYVIPHRVIFREEYETLEKKEFIRSLLEQVQVPA